MLEDVEAAQTPYCDCGTVVHSPRNRPRLDFRLARPDSPSQPGNILFRIFNCPVGSRIDRNAFEGRTARDHLSGVFA